MQLLASYGPTVGPPLREFRIATCSSSMMMVRCRERVLVPVSARGAAARPSVGHTQAWRHPGLRPATWDDFIELGAGQRGIAHRGG